MCVNCDYPRMMQESGLAATAHRLRVLEIVGNNPRPMNAGAIYAAIRQNGGINRVTVYRILDLLVEHGLIDRISTGTRSFHYGLAPNENHRPHPHFYCRRCKNIECLGPETLHMDLDPLARTFPGRIDTVEIRIDGICSACLKEKKPAA